MKPPYRRVLFEQGSEEWHQWRSTGIGASDAPVIMGENPWKTIPELLGEKRAGGGGGMNEAMARGVALEPSAQAAYGKQLGKMVEPACLESLQYPWMRASVDGISVCGSHLVEIKCGESVYRKTAAARNPPNYYVGQLQHALAVTELEAMDFWCFLPHRPPVHVVVKRDIPYITRLIDTERRFYERHFTC